MVTTRRSARLAGKVARQDAATRTSATGAKGRKPRKVRQLVVRYLVKWKGYGVEEATWERADSLRLHAQDSIDDYERRQAELRGEDTVGVHYLHTLCDHGGGRVSLHTAAVGDQ